MPAPQRTAGLIVAIAWASLWPSNAWAVGEPDPVNAVVLSTSSTLVPLGIAAGLLATGDGSREGIRFDLALAFTALGATVGPSVGQFYARGGTNAWVTLGLRLATSTAMTAGMGVKLRGAPEDQTLGNALLWLGLVPTTLLGLYDIVTAYSTARESKYRDTQIARRTELGLTPELVSVARCGAMPCSSRSEFAANRAAD
ncbi:MAG: hypothetical protein AAFN74_27120 [Myxococcota bacterium]